MRFDDRRDAGRRLAERLEEFRGQDVVVLGLPRGGVPVAAEVARALDAPLDVVVVRKVGVPFRPELAMGAVGEGGVRVTDRRVLALARVSPADLAAAQQRESDEIEARVRRFRGDRPRVPLVGRTAVLVDDGIATGSTARAACAVVRALGAGRIVLAAPVCAASSIRQLAADADELVFLQTPRDFAAVGQFYADFRPTGDDEVVELLHRAAREHVGAPDPPPRDEEVAVRAAGVDLAGHLTVPERASGMVIVVDGSGSSRHSAGNRSVADVLRRAGLATLLLDLLTPEEDGNRAAVFDIELPAQRLTETTAWVRTQPGWESRPIGWFGAGTGAGAALRAAAEPDADVAAVVSRGGRPDLAGDRLSDVRVPTLLIVGGRDRAVLELNEAARAHLHCENRLAVVPGATHLFEEPGTLATAAALARDWFAGHLGGGHPPSVPDQAGLISP